MFADKVFYDVCLFQGGYVPDECGGSLTVQKYSVLNVSPLSIQGVGDLIDEMVGCLSDFDMPVSCRYLRVRGVHKGGRAAYESGVNYIAVCGESHRNFHDDAIRVIKPYVRNIVEPYPVVIETGYVDLSVRKL